MLLNTALVPRIYQQVSAINSQVFMILYNVTVNVEQSIEEEWLHWMKSEHVLDIINTGLIKNAKIFRLLHVEQSPGTETYAVQYFAQSLQDFHTYQAHHSAEMNAMHDAKFGSKAVSFRTLMQEV